MEISNPKRYYSPPQRFPIEYSVFYNSEGRGRRAGTSEAGQKKEREPLPDRVCFDVHPLCFDVHFTISLPPLVWLMKNFA